MPVAAAALEASYNDLPPAAQLTYRALSLHPGTEPVSIDAAAELADLDVEATTRALGTLTDADLLTETPPAAAPGRHARPRYRLCHEGRVHARGLAERTDPAADLDAALERVDVWYLNAAVAAQLVLNPDRWYASPLLAKPRGRRLFTDLPDALAWLQAEQHNLREILTAAYRRGQHRRVVALAEAMWGLIVHAKPYQLGFEVYSIGLQSATVLGDALAQARMHQGLGYVCTCLNKFSDAKLHHHDSLLLARSSEHQLAQVAQASALEGLGVCAAGTGDHAGAINLFEQSRNIHKRIGGDRRGQLICTRHIGQVLLADGRPGDAIAQLTEAADAHRRQPAEQYLTARALTPLGIALREVGRLDEAEVKLWESLKLTMTIGARHEEANARRALAGLADIRGQAKVRVQELTKALDIYHELAAPEAEPVRRELDAIFRARDHLADIGGHTDAPFDDAENDG